MVESRTKTKLTQAQIGALLGAAFDDATLRSAEELTDGYFNSVYRVEADGRPPLALKVAPPDDVDVLTYEHGLMRAEVEAMRLVEGDADVPIPRVRFADLSRTTLPVDFFFMDLVPGTSWTTLRDDLTEAQNAEIERQLGAITARVNRVVGPGFGYLGTGPRFGRWSAALRWMLATLYADARRFGIESPVPESELLGAVARYSAALDAITEPRLVHWDVWAGNVFGRIDADGPTVTGVIDFERALWGDPLMEFIPSRLGDIAAYEAGYGQPQLATREQRLRRLLYNAYLGLVLVVEDGPRQYADKTTVEWGRGLLERAAAMLRHGDVIEALVKT